MSEASKTFGIWDNGLNTPLAFALARAGHRILYHTAWDQEYPTIVETCLGDGFTDYNIERCDDLFLQVDEIDCFVFPNRGHIGEQLILERFGKPVFGSKAGTNMESRRRQFLKLQEKLHMDVPEYVVVTGVTALAKHLRPLQDKWIKIDKYRRDSETWKWHSWDESQGELDRLAVKFGPFKEEIPFIVQDEIETMIEAGGDIISIDGQWASHGVIGVEGKDKAYLASLRTWEEMDPIIKEVLIPLEPTLKELRYRNFLSTEQRKTDDSNYLTDLTPRLGFPSGNCQIHLYDNLPEVILAGAEGTLIPIKPRFNFAVEVLMDHTCPYGDWRALRIPEKVLPWINMTSVAKHNDAYHFVPNDVHDSCVGSISGEGDTIEECMANLMKHVEALDGQPITVRLDTVKDLLKEVKVAETKGIEFADASLPDPAEIMENAEA